MTSLSMVSLVRMESNRHVESLEEGLVKVSLERLSVVTDSMVEAFSPYSSEAMTITGMSSLLTAQTPNPNLPPTSYNTAFN